tara:strand:+ start:5600 stop:5995 length:396 start_codon:yes stop_codon:yes gene_type:complete
MGKIILISLLIASFTLQANAKKKESYYQNIHCDNLGGKAEYKLEDRTRIDCLTDTKAIEHDFAHKWAECAGQAIYYAQRMNLKYYEQGMNLKLKPVCALIGTEKQFKRYIPRIETINKNLIDKIEIIKIYQ